MGERKDNENESSRMSKYDNGNHGDGNGIGETTLDLTKLGFYGRDEELKLLQKAFRNISNEAAAENNAILNEDDAALERSQYHHEHIVEFAVISGASGVGKSTLIQKFKESLPNNNKCCFIMGKYEQTMEAVPYSAVVSAFGQLCDYVSKSRNSKSIIQELKKGMRSEHRLVLANTMECFWNLFDDLPHDKRRPSFYENTVLLRMQYIVRDLMRLLSRHIISPIVMVLEDLQWSDTSSLQLLRTLISDQYSTFLCIATYRNEQVGDTHPLSLLLHSLVHTTTSITEMELPALTHETIHAAISDILSLEQDNCITLAHQIYQTTKGNMLFVLHYVKMLHERGCIHCSNGQWQCTPIPDLNENVLQLVTEELDLLSKDAHKLLTIASCLGSQFSVVALTCVWTHLHQVDVDDYLTMEQHGVMHAPTSDELQSVISLLSEAAGLVIPCGPIDSNTTVMYAFAHDRVQQAAYTAIPNDPDKLEMHFKIGKILFPYSLGVPEELSEHKDRTRLLAAITQLNQGSALIIDPAVKVQLARLNLVAADCVMLKSGFVTAVDYLQQGLDLLDPSERWTQHYDLSLLISSKLAEISYSCRDFVTCKHNVDYVVQNGHCFQDKFNVYYTLIQSLGSQNRIDEAFEVGMQVLDILGEKLVPTKLRLASNLFKCRKAINSRSMEELLLNGPVMVRKDKIQAIKVLRALAMLAWFTDQTELFVHIQMRIFQITLKHGASPHSSFGLACLGMIFGSNGNVADAYKVGVIATSMSQKFHSSGCDGMTTAIVHTMLNHFRQPLKVSIEPVMKSYQSAIASGDIEGAAYAANAYIHILRASGTRLDIINAEAARFAELMKDYNMTQLSIDQALTLLIPQWQFALNLAGESKNPVKLSGAAMHSEEQFIAECVDANNVKALLAIYSAKMSLGYYFGDIKAAYTASQNLLKVDKKKYCPCVPRASRILFLGLVEFEMHRQTKRKQHLQSAVRCISKLQEWHKNGDPNVRHLELILQAELASLGTNASQRKASFDAAIEACRRNGSHHDEALANQRASVFCLKDGDTSLASYHMVNAKNLYSQWGATALAEYVKTKYSYLFYDQNTSASSEHRMKTRRRKVKA
jgi:predicted ATPase